MRRTNRTIGLGLLSGLLASAQQGGITSNANPANIIWGVVALLGSMASAYLALSLIWTGMQGVMVDHDQFHKLPRIAFWAAIIFSATAIALRMALGG